MAMQTEQDEAARASAAGDWPAEVDLVISALEAGQCEPAKIEQRRWPRHAYRVRADLRLFSDPPSQPYWTLFIRDAHRRGMGFVTRHRLPLGYGGLIALPAPDGSEMEISVTLVRCRQAAPGWFEGAVYFNRDQQCFHESPAVAHSLDDDAVDS